VSVLLCISASRVCIPQKKNKDHMRVVLPLPSPKITNVHEISAYFVIISIDRQTLCFAPRVFRRNASFGKAKADLRSAWVVASPRTFCSMFARNHQLRVDPRRQHDESPSQVAHKYVMDRQKALLFGSAAAIRLLLFTAFPSLPPVLTGRVEISTPVTSFKRCMLLHAILCKYS
jgi:hypothetical protein